MNSFKKFFEEISPEMKKEIEAIVKKLDDQDFQAKYGSDWEKEQIRTAIKIIKRKKATA